LRTPSSSAVAAPVIGAPPPPTTPTNANCEPPLNNTNDSTHVCRIVNPDAVEIAPNERPYAPVATPTPIASRNTARRAVDHDGSVSLSSSSTTPSR
jgi:hypothetical protein